MLTKKHFEAIARIIYAKNAHYTRKDKEWGMAYTLAYDLATYFSQENPNFDRARFMEAAGFKGAF